MYWGSVRFFKHVILGVISLVFLWAIVLTVSLFLPKKEVGVQVLSKAVKQVENGSPEDLDGLLKEGGVDAEALAQVMDAQSILDALQKKDQDAFAKAYQEVTKLPVGQGPSYTQLFPELYTTPPTQAVYKEKTVYLTFDDGPSPYTDQVLATLAKYGIKATFFVVPDDSEEDAARMRAIVEAGHTLGVHSATHVYDYMYESVDNYLNDFNTAVTRIKNATGQMPTIYRFPGGSINSYNQLVYRPIISEMVRRGFVYYDWNVSGGDTTRNASANSVKNAVVSGVQANEHAIVLLHDGPGEPYAAEALDGILAELTTQGYAFDKLDNNVKPTFFGYTLE